MSTYDGALYGGAIYGGAGAGSGYAGSLQRGWWIDRIAADALVGSQPEITPSREISLTFTFDERYGYAPLSRYEELRERCEVAQAVALLELIDGTPKFREQHQREPGTLVARFEPGPDIESSQGFWGLITGYEDLTRVAQQRCQLSLEVVVLAALEEYRDKSALLEALAI